MARRWMPVSRLAVSYRDDGPAQLVGELAQGRVVAFQYAAEWLVRGTELSPEHLPISVGREVQVGPTGRLHGLFADALPDAWGERVMRMAFLRAGVAWTDVTPLDRLAALGDRAMGALSFAPARELESRPVADDSLDELLAAADAIARGEVPEHDGEVLDRLQRAAGSAGGAQPKVLVGLRESDGQVGTDPEPSGGFTPWLVKFSPRTPAMDLSPMSGVIEEAYAGLARAAGLTVPATRLLRTRDGRLHFAARRFDRTPEGGRRHVHSLAGLLGRDAADPFDYDELLRVAASLTGDQRAVREAFARGVFNVLTANDDDHGRNTAFLLDPVRGWTLSPAYDLTFQPGRGTRGMAVLGHERGITAGSFRELARRNGIPGRLAEEMFERVRAAVRTWPATAAAAGVPEPWQEEVGAVLARREVEFFAG